MSYEHEKPASVGLQDVGPKLAVDTDQEIKAEEEAHVGVKAVEAAEKVHSPYSKWIMFIGIALASYMYSLDGQTTSNYFPFATSAFGHHSLIATIQVAQSVIVSCGNPVVAKFADVTSRATTFLFVLAFYILGYILVSSSHGVSALAAGLILYAVGKSGLLLLVTIIVADITTIKWRGLVFSLTSAPYIINAFIGSNVATQVLKHAGWRWGYGMFTILVPASFAPLVITLFWAEQKAKRLGLVNTTRRVDTSPDAPVSRQMLKRIWAVGEQLDVVGLVLIGASVALILLPLTLAPNAQSQWHNGSMIAMLTVGCVLLPVIGVWEVYFAKRPVFPRRLLRNRTVLIAAAIGFVDFISLALSQTYLYSFILITKDWSLLNATYFRQTRSVALTFFSVIAGILLRYTHRYKLLLIIALATRLLGVGLMIHSRGAQGSDAELVMTQILQGLGGGLASVCSQVAAQASVPHADTATTIALLYLWTEIGGAVGTATAGAIWTTHMPHKLAEHLPNANQTTIDQLFGSISDVLRLPYGDPTRAGVIAAYGDVMRLMLVGAAVLAAVPLALSCFMPDWYLGDKQNALDEAGLAGERAAA